MAMEYVALYQRMGVLACNPPVSLTHDSIIVGLNAARSGLWNCVIVCGKTAAAHTVASVSVQTPRSSRLLAMP